MRLHAEKADLVLRDGNKNLLQQSMEGRVGNGEAI